MLQTKQFPAFLVVVLYAVGAAALAALLITTGASDAWLYLLVVPVLLAAGFYPRWVYFSMSLGTLLAAGSVVVLRSPEGGPGLRNVCMVVALILANSELLHRMMQARLRAEAELRTLLEREQEARAQALAAQERFAFLAAASESLAGSLDLTTTLREVARQAVPYLADICVTRLAAPGDEEEQTAGAHADAAKEPLLEELRLRYGLDLGLPRHVQSPQNVRIAEETLLTTARDEEHQRLLRELKPRSALVVPLGRKEQPLGTMAFVRTGSGRAFGGADVELAKELARRAAIALENARLHGALQDADRRKMEFLAMLAHELRNPLSAISNSGYLLERLTPAGERTGRLVAAITRQSRHLARLVDDLLEVSRITQGKLELRKEPVDVVAATRDAVESVRPLLEQRQHQLHVSLPDERIWIRADPTRYEQVLVNLLSNAAKYTGDGGHISLSVEREAESVPSAWRVEREAESGPSSEAADGPSRSTLYAPRSTAVIRVRDTGAGIEPELLPQIFDLFTQGDTPLHGPRSGLGIGLTLVRRIVELHGGTVSAHSEGRGRGSEFVVRLPALKDEGGRMKDERSKPDALHPPSFGLHPSKSVLVVDDDRDAAETLFELLEMWGHRVWLARDGARGIDAAREHHPQVALLDIGMPGIDGYEVARRLRAAAETRDMVLVALTGYGGDEDRKRAREAGFDYHLVKPPDPEELQRLLMSA